jgi:hypothetical protein
VNGLRFPLGVSPRLGVAHDPTGEGRARLFAQWSRLIEALPTDVVSAQRSRHAWVTRSELAGTVDSAYVPGGMRFDPALRPGQIDELVAGAEYEVMPALALGIAWQHRALGSAVEDVSADPSGFILTNPDGTQGSGIPAASRRYDAVIVTATRRLSRLYLLASYVHARRHGTYPGPYGDEGQGDPARTSPQFDRPDLVAGGVLPLDRRHTLKLDASYPVPLGPSSALILGTRMRALSGTPRSVTGEGVWGTQQLLPRGALGREDPLYAIDLRIGYRRELGRGVSADLYVDVFNVLDRQEPYNVDDRWTDFTQTTLPIRGGTYGDLIWLKATQRFARPDEVAPAARNRDFGRVRSRYAARFATLGARLVW